MSLQLSNQMYFPALIYHWIISEEGLIHIFLLSYSFLDLAETTEAWQALKTELHLHDWSRHIDP